MVPPSIQRDANLHESRAVAAVPAQKSVIRKPVMRKYAPSPGQRRLKD